MFIFWVTESRAKSGERETTSFSYEGVKLECGYRLDLLVEDQVIIEIKSIEALNDIHLAQVLTYLKLSDNRIGLLINFNVLQLIKGLKRVINKYKK